MLKTGLAATLAHQSELVDDPATRHLRRPAPERGRRAHDRRQQHLRRRAGVDENLADTDDARVRFANALAVSMSRRLALQVGLLLLYDHQPSLVDLPLFDVQGTPSGSVAARAATLDTTFTVSVVLSFAPGRPRRKAADTG